MKLSSSQRESLEWATSIYEDAMPDSPAEEYLAGRGIDATVAATFRLGFVAAPVVGHEDYKGRLCIPYITPAGVVDLRFRDITDTSSAKYLGRAGAQLHLYNVGALAEDSPYIGISEGEVDAITAQGVAHIPCVGVPGTQAWKPFYRRAFEDYQQVFLFVDGDDAGRAFAKKMVNEVENALPVYMPDGLDVNSFVQQEGITALRRKAGLND